MNNQTDITWPDIQNYLFETGYFTNLSPNESKIHDALLYKLNKLYFPEYLEISNTEIIGLTGLSLKAVIQARNSLIKKLCYSNEVWTYKSRESQRLSGHYFFNYELIRNSIRTRQELTNNKTGKSSCRVPETSTQNDTDLNITKQTNNSFSKKDNNKNKREKTKKEIEDWYYGAGQQMNAYWKENNLPVPFMYENHQKKQLMDAGELCNYDYKQFGKYALEALDKKLLDDEVFEYILNGLRGEACDSQ